MRDAICLFSTQINLHDVLKMSAFGTYMFSVLNATGQQMRKLCFVQCYVNVHLHNWKQWAMHQTK